MEEWSISVVRAMEPMPMSPTPPSGQGPIDPRAAFPSPPPPGHPSAGPAGMPPRQYPPQYAPQNSPPPYMMPPPFMMPPPPPPRGSGLRTLFVVLGLLILLGSLFINFALLVKNATDISGVQQDTIVSGDSSQKVAVLPITGEITHQSADRFIKLLNQVQDDSNVKALVIDMDTPGGEVSASDEIYHALTAYKSTHNNAPIVVSMGALGTSGGYYVSCAADEIYAEPTTITGNIGVLLPRLNFSKFADKWGIEDNSIAATGTPYKTAGSMWREETKEETDYIRGLIDAAASQFRLVVSTGRKGKLQKPLEEIADGRAYDATYAKSIGLIDHQGYLMDACDRAAAMANLSKKTVVRFDRAPGMFQLLEGAQSGIPAFNSSSVNTTNGGINLQVDGSLLHNLTDPHPLYLWRGQ